MSRRRFLSTEISLDAKVNRLASEHGDFAVLLYTWLIPHSQDDATLKGTPEEILWAVMPGRRDKTPEDVARALDAMQAVGLLWWDKLANTVYFPVESFYKYQTYVKPVNRRSEEPRKTLENIEEHCASAENSVSLSPSLSPSLSTTTATRARACEDRLAPREETVETPATGPDPIAEMDAATREDAIHAIEERLGVMNPTVIFRLTGYLDLGATPGLILWAIHEAELNGIYRANYVQSIIKRNLEEGHATAGQAEGAKERWEAEKTARAARATGGRGRAAPSDIRGGAPPPTNSGDEDPAIREYFKRWGESATTDEEMRALGLYTEEAAASGETGITSNDAPGGTTNRPTTGADAGTADL